MHGTPKFITHLSSANLTKYEEIRFFMSLKRLYDGSKWTYLHFGYILYVLPFLKQITDWFVFCLSIKREN